MRKTSFILILSIILLAMGCSSKEIVGKKGINISGISSSIGAVGQNINDFENQSFKYTITLTNNEDYDITVTSITPVLSEAFANTVDDKNVTIKVNKIIPKSNSIEIPGEIIFNTKALSKEQILGLKPFVKEIIITEEKILRYSF